MIQTTDIVKAYNRKLYVIKDDVGLAIRVYLLLFHATEIQTSVNLVKQSARTATVSVYMVPLWSFGDYLYCTD